MPITITKPTALKYYFLLNLLCCAACVQHNNSTPAKSDTSVNITTEIPKVTVNDNTSFDILVNKTNKAFSLYYSIQPNYERYPVSKFNITKVK